MGRDSHTCNQVGPDLPGLKAHRSVGGLEFGAVASGKKALTSSSMGGNLTPIVYLWVGHLSLLGLSFLTCNVGTATNFT